MSVNTDSKARVERHLSRSIRIGERPLFVVDGLFAPADVASLYEFLLALPHHLNDTDSEATAYSLHWKHEFPVEMALATPIFKDCVQAACDLMMPETLRLRRVHANLQMYGDMQFPHHDLAGGVTAIYYANPEWDEKWLGETVFYDDTREPLTTVAPRPGRLAVFDADILHRAGVPSRECYRPRISVAFKFKRT